MFLMCFDSFVLLVECFVYGGLTFTMLQSMLSRFFFGCFSGTDTSIIRKRVHDRVTSEVEQELSFTQHYHNDSVSFSVAPTLSSSKPVPRQWVVRLHLPKGHAVASFDSAVIAKPKTLPPMPEGEMYFPFGGSGSPPAHLAGSIFEFQLLTGGSRGATSTSIELVVGVPSSF